MKSGVVFAVTFLVLVAVTFVFPAFPPAQLILDFVGMPQTSMSILGIPMVFVLSGVVNGLLWAVVALAVYGAASYGRGREPLPSLPEPPKLSTPPIEPNPVDTLTDKMLARAAPPVKPRGRLWSLAKTRLFRLEQNIEMIDGIGPAYGALLRNSGISTVNDLLTACATERKRQSLADEIGVPYNMLLRWVYRGDLLRVKGVGRKYAGLLESAGVNTVSDLSSMNPRLLSNRLSVLNAERRLVKRTPPSKEIEMWVYTARALEPLVQ